MRYMPVLAAFTLAVTAFAQEAEVPAKTDTPPPAPSQVTPNAESGVSHPRIKVVLAHANEVDTGVKVFLESQGVSSECILTPTGPCSLDFSPGTALVSGGRVVKGKLDLPPDGGVLTFHRSGYGAAWVGGGLLLVAAVSIVAGAGTSGAFGGLIPSGWGMLGVISLLIGAPLLIADLIAPHEWFEFEPAGHAALPRERPLFASARLTLTPTGMSFVASF